MNTLFKLLSHTHLCMKLLGLLSSCFAGELTVSFEVVADKVFIQGAVMFFWCRGR